MRRWREEWGKEVKEDEKRGGGNCLSRERKRRGWEERRSGARKGYRQDDRGRGGTIKPKTP